MLIRLAALLLALAGPAAAQDYNQPDIVRGLCQKDGCDEFRVLSAELVPLHRGFDGLLGGAST